MAKATLRRAIKANGDRLALLESFLSAFDSTVRMGKLASDNPRNRTVADQFKQARARLIDARELLG